MKCFNCPLVEGRIDSGLCIDVQAVINGDTEPTLETEEFLEQKNYKTICRNCQYNLDYDEKSDNTIPELPEEPAPESSNSNEEAPDLPDIDVGTVVYDGTLLQKEDSDFSVIRSFLHKVSNELLNNSPRQNVVISPLCLFHAITILAAISENDIRKEILQALGCKDLDYALHFLKQYGPHDFKKQDCTVSSILSVNTPMTPSRDRITALSKELSTIISCGDMNSDSYKNALLDLFGKENGNLFYPSALQESHDLLLYTSVLFKDEWINEFSPQRSKIEEFQTASGETSCLYMQASLPLWIQTTDFFTAVPLELAHGKALWFILPKEGLSPEEMLLNGFWQSFSPESDALIHWNVYLSIPVFTFSTDMELIRHLQMLGIRKFFDSNAQLNYIDPAFIAPKKSINSFCRISVNEKGCGISGNARQNSDYSGTESILPKLEFHLNRPFLFVLTDEETIPLLAGIVNKP